MKHSNSYRYLLRNFDICVETLELRQAKSDLLMVYKMLNGFVDLPIERCLVRWCSNHEMHAKHYFILRPKCRVMQDLFFNRIIHV